MTKTKKIIIAGLLLAVGLALPKIFHLFGPELSKLFSPLHLPAFFSGLILGAPYGILVGGLLPLLSSVITGMPMLVPMGVSMCFELATYGGVSGYLYKKINIWCCILIAIVCGRISFTLVQGIQLGFSNVGQWWVLFSANIVSGIPAIMFQIILIPLVIKGIKKYI